MRRASANSDPPAALLLASPPPVPEQNPEVRTYRLPGLRTPNNTPKHKFKVGKLSLVNTSSEKDGQHGNFALVFCRDWNCEMLKSFLRRYGLPMERIVRINRTPSAANSERESDHIACTAALDMLYRTVPSPLCGEARRRWSQQEHSQLLFATFSEYPILVNFYVTNSQTLLCIRNLLTSTANPPPLSIAFSSLLPIIQLHLPQPSCNKVRAPTNLLRHGTDLICTRHHRRSAHARHKHERSDRQLPGRP